MIPFLAATAVLSALQGAAKPREDGPILPKPTTIAVPNDVRDWAGFKYLPAGNRTIPGIFPVGGDWSSVKTAPSSGAAVWRTKVVVLTRVDRVHEHGSGIVWPGHHSIDPPNLARIRRALPQLRALVAEATHGTVDLAFDIAEETEPQTVQGGDMATTVARYLLPRINGGVFQSEDAVFRGPYQSVFVFQPAGGEKDDLFEVQGTPVTVIGLPDVEGQESDGVLAMALAKRWSQQVGLRAHDAGYQGTGDTPQFSAPDWAAVLAGHDASTEQRLRLLKEESEAPIAFPQVERTAGRGAETSVRLVKDPERKTVLGLEELGSYRAGGFALPIVAAEPIDVSKTPTLSFWMKSEARDPIVLQFGTENTVRSVWLGRDVPFAYDGAWHPVKVDLRPLPRVSWLAIVPDASARGRQKETLGPILASFDDFEATTEAADSQPQPEPASPVATAPEVRARWAASAEPGEQRRALLKDPVEAVRANAAMACLLRPDAADESALIDAAMYNYDPSVFGPALHALGSLKTPGVQEGLQRVLRTAASDRARGVAAEVLAETNDPKYVPFFLGLNQARSRAARVSAIHALGRLPGSDAAMMRLAFLPQNDAEIKLEATLTADANDDYQGRKLLWSAVNEPSDAVRLESLKRLSYSGVPEFAEAGMKGVKDDSVGVRVGLLDAWGAAMRREFLPSVKLALDDRSPRVRAAALRALAAFEEPASTDDVSKAFSDSDPQVQLAALELAKAKHLTVPAEIMEKLRQSPDPQVRATAG